MAMMPNLEIPVRLDDICPRHHPIRFKVPIPLSVAAPAGRKRQDIASRIYRVGEIEAKRRRKSAPKTREGCKTCKIRHEKCDETKPACTKCTRTGRKCDFVSPSEKSQTLASDRRTSMPWESSTFSYLTPILTPSSPLPNFRLDERDGQFFQYLVHGAGKSFFSTCESPIWSLILQAAQTEEIIRSVALANSIMHNLYPYIAANPGDPTYVPVYNSALRHYSNSVRSLKKRLNNVKGTPDLATWEVSILASFLFTSFEVLQGNEKGAHWENINGFKMMKSVLNTYRAQPNQLELPGNLKTLALGLNRRDLQASTFGYAWNTQALLPPNVPDIFPSWNDAATALETLLPNILGLIRTHAGSDPCRRWSHIQPESMLVRIESLKATLQHWFQTFEKWLCYRKLFASSAGLSKVQENQEMSIHHTLMIQYWNAYIWVRTPFAQSQTVFDKYLPQFTHIVSFSEEILDMNPEKKNTFSSESEIIQPLFFVAQKCRDGDLRRKALGLLMRSGREGVWDGMCVAVAGKLVMEMEEEGLEEGVTGKVVEGTKGWVEDKYRLRGLHLHISRLKRELMVKGRRIGSDGQETWAGKSICWGKQEEGGAERRVIYGDEDEVWHWGFLFG